jgi:PAS domain S-box-containing protein
VGFVTFDGKMRRSAAGCALPRPEFHGTSKIMTVANKPRRPDTAPALFRLLAESALSRAALGSCGMPLALVDAEAKGNPFTFANAAFQAFFGYGEAEALNRPLADLLFRGDAALVQRLLAEGPRRWELTAWGKDGEVRHVDTAVAAIRSVEGRLSHWVVAFSDRGEVERLRLEVESLKALAASSLGLRQGGQPARSAQQPRVEIPAADELHADRHPRRVL